MSTKPAIQPSLRKAIEHLGRLSELFQQRREQLAKEVGLTLGQWQVLEEIGGEEFMPSMFARRRESTAAAVSKVLRQLQDQGYVSASISPSDGRHRKYVLTGEGERVLERLRESRERAIRDIWMTLDPAEVEGFIRFSTQLIGRLETYGQPGQE